MGLSRAEKDAHTASFLVFSLVLAGPAASFGLGAGKKPKKNAPKTEGGRLS